MDGSAILQPGGVKAAETQGCKLIFNLAKIYNFSFFWHYFS
jgi:hypothetical protein